MNGQDIDSCLEMTRGCRIVSSNLEGVLPDDIIIDSSTPVIVPNLRIDHHVDDGWTNLDSIAKYCQSVPQQEVQCPSVISSYLDPDAIISAAVLILHMQRKLDIHNLLFTDFGKSLYSASYWCDYQTACDHFPSSLNGLGDQLEFWLRREIQEDCGEDRACASHADQTFVFQKLVAAMMLSISQTRFPPACECLDVPGEIVKMKEMLRPYVRNDLSTDAFGVIWTFDDAPGFRIISRSYFSLFTQPIIVRIIESRKGLTQAQVRRQVFIAPNPSQSGWQFWNLPLLGNALRESYPACSLTGRRLMIGQSRTSWPVDKFIDALRQIGIRRFRDSECPNWSIYEGHGAIPKSAIN